MRDRETDSWWSIMSSDAIGGELEGEPLSELPISEKATWGDWSSRYPESLVLSIDGSEHVDQNPYDGYFASEGTFRNLVIDDDRLTPKAPIYSFFRDGKPYAVAHESFQGGGRFALGDDKTLFLYRETGSPIFASSEAWVVDNSKLEGLDSVAEVRGYLQGEGSGEATAVGGFDTFWYSWVSINETSEVLK